MTLPTRRTAMALIALFTLVAGACGDDPDPPLPGATVVVSSLGGDQALPRAAADGEGGVYVAWFSNPDQSNYDARLQRFDDTGAAQWEEDGVVVSDGRSATFITDYSLAVDPAGDAIVVFQDVRDGPHNVRAVKVRSDGEHAWGEDGVQLSDDPAFESPATTNVVQGEAGTSTLTVVWVREDDDRTNSVVVQRLGEDGTPLWGDGGLVAAGAVGERNVQPVLVDGGDGAVILVWGIETVETQELELFAQKIGPDGSPQWSQPVAIGDGVQSFAFASVSPDGDGGAFVAWNTVDLVSFAQHVGSDGMTSWPDGGVPVVDSGTSDLQIDPQVVRAPDGADAIVTWTHTDRDQRMRGVRSQRFSRDGELSWGADGVVVVAETSAEQGPIEVGVDDDGVVVGLIRGEDGTGLNGRVTSVRVGDDGDPDRARDLTAADSEKGSLTTTQRSDGAWVYAWSDGPVDDGEIRLLVDP